MNLNAKFGLTRRCFFLIFVCVSGLTSRAEDLTYDRHIRPILAKHCFVCHGPDPDARQADLRLDQAESAYEDRGGYAAIKPGDPAASELIVRVTTGDDDLRMPPSDSHSPLSSNQIELLTAWIRGGAKYEAHWAFVPPKRPAIPEVDNAAWCRNPIDRFVLARMNSNGLSPSPQASRVELVRRLHLDLLGVTPTPGEVERFVNDDRPGAYERLVDDLLSSPDYAQRFARPWLDLARYSDTNGYEKDRPRTIWPYRDWVINALNADMPFDQFSIEQIAGDMLENASVDQRIATGFHRNTMINEEGGIDPQEYRFYSIVDRVATTGTIWMGLTTGCAQCHTHKYDPITHTDYYALFALLNHADEPDLVVPNDQIDQQRQELQQLIDRETAKIVREHLPEFSRIQSVANTDEQPLAKGFAKWVSAQQEAARHWRPLRPSQMTTTMPKLTVLDDASILASGDVTKREVYQLTFHLTQADLPAKSLRIEVLPHPSLPAGGPGVAFYEGRRGDFFLSEVTAKHAGQRLELQDPTHSYGKITIGSGGARAENVIDGEGSTGWSTSGHEGKRNQLVLNFDAVITTPGEFELELLFERHFAAALGHFRVSICSQEAVASKLSDQLETQLLEPLTQASYQSLAVQYVLSSESFKSLRGSIDRWQRQMPAYVRTMALQQQSREDYRVTRRHHRGEYLQQKEVVQPGIPAVFGGLGESVTADRLSLAKWLVSRKNPLVARVVVNRAWREFFGTGIVRTAGDYGTQSEPPSHPRLIDWLAEEVRQGDWSMKRLHRQIVTSSTYRQSVGRVSDVDPDNRLLSSFPYRRCNAETIRDSFLTASGLMHRQIGGPSVYPPQPSSVSQLAYGNPKWNVSGGADRYRRSLYTFGKRTAPFAAYLTFDGPTGEQCLPRRQESTTPLQALTLLNDQMFMEIATGLAESVMREVADDYAPEVLATRMFRRVLVRSPSKQELEDLLEFYRSNQSHPKVWALLARAILNTDEAITLP